MTKAFFTEKPDKIKYMTSGEYADVWLRTNINEVESEDGTQWSADENYFRVKKSTMSADYVREHFEELLDYQTDASDAATSYKRNVTIEERIKDIEAALAELFIGGVEL